MAILKVEDEKNGICKVLHNAFANEKINHIEYQILLRNLKKHVIMLGYSSGSHDYPILPITVKSALILYKNDEIVTVSFNKYRKKLACSSYHKLTATMWDDSTEYGKTRCKILDLLNKDLIELRKN